MRCVSFISLEFSMSRWSGCGAGVFIKADVCFATLWLCLAECCIWQYWHCLKLHVSHTFIFDALFVHVHFRFLLVLGKCRVACTASSLKDNVYWLSLHSMEMSGVTVTLLLCGSLSLVPSMIHLLVYCVLRRSWLQLFVCSIKRAL